MSLLPFFYLSIYLFFLPLSIYSSIPPCNPLPMHLSTYSFIYSTNNYGYPLCHRCCNRQRGEYKNQEDAYSSFKEFNWLWETEVARYQEKCYKSQKHKSLEKAKREDYFLQEAMETFTEEVTAKLRPSKDWRLSLGKDSKAKSEDNYFSMAI